MKKHNAMIKLQILSRATTRLRSWPALLGICCASVVVAEVPNQLSDWDAAKETLVVFNPAFEGSEDLAKYYAEERGIPADHLLGLKCSDNETITREEFENTLREPLLRNLISKKFWHMEKRDTRDPNGKLIGSTPTVVKQDVKVLVLMRGIPVRVQRAANPPDLKPMEVDEASVDSELAATGLVQRPLKGPLENRYYQSLKRFPEATGARGQLIVARLDAADDVTVRRMIDDSIKAEREGLWGRAVLDFSLMDGGYEEGEQWLGRCAKLYHDNGIPVLTDRYKELIPDAWPLPDTILYFGWYTNTIRGALASPDFRFKRGAIACHLHSFSAEVLRSTTKAWVGPLLDRGAAAALGNVWEPYLTLTVHFDILNARLMEGFTLGEAAWAATPGLSWMNVLVGDPLYRPFPRNRVMLSDEPRDLDYALFHELSKRYVAHDSKKFRREVLAMASEKKSPRLLELAGLLCATEGSYGQSGDFFQHAQSAYREPADQVRCALYAAEIARRKGDAGEAAEILEGILANSKLAQVPALTAATAMLRVVKPK